MTTRKLGNSDLAITPVVFGAWAIGGWMWGGNEASESIDAIRAAIDAGITTIDTAAIYGQGYSEELVAKAIKGQRDKVIVATKCGMRWNTTEGSDPWNSTDADGKPVLIVKNAKPDSIAYECEQSLKRLQTDVIDLYQIHWPDSSTPVEDSIRAMERLHQQGKVRAIGVSNYNVEWLDRAYSAVPFASLQPPYSALRRGIENDILPWCRSHNVGTIVYSPMERGLLTGKVDPNRTFAEGDHRAKHPYFTPENRKRVLAALTSLQPLAETHNATFAQLIIAWTFNQPGITAAIVGARNAEQSRQNAAAMKVKLSADDIAQITRTFEKPEHQMQA